jgi:ABC-type lipoprotein release transport system permease subunit
VSAFVPDPADASLFTRVDRPKVLAGVRPRSDRAWEAAVTPDAARSLHIRVGQTITFRSVPLGQVDRSVDGLFEPAPPPRPLPPEALSAGPAINLTIVGIEVASGDREFTLGGAGDLHLSPAFASQWPSAPYRPAIAVIPRPRASRLAIQRGLRSYIIGYPVDLDQQDLGAARVRRSTHILANALNSFGILLAIVALVAVGQGLIRQTEHGLRDDEVLRALGMSRRQRHSIVTAEAFVVGMAGGILGVAIAVATSPFTPIGLARVIEPTLGFSVDWPWLAAGWAIVVSVVALLGAGSAWLVARGRDRPLPARGRLATARRQATATLSPLAVPVSATIGISLAAGRSDRRRGSATVAIVGSVLAVGTAAGALSFDAGLSQLLNTPRLYGWNWDAYVGNPFRGLTPAQTTEVDDRLSHDPAIVGFSQGIFANLEVSKTDQRDLAPAILPVGGFDNLRGDVLPPILDPLTGRHSLATSPLGSNEIVVGSDTLRRYHLHVGDWVQLKSPTAANGGIFAQGASAGASHAEQVRVVGREVVAHLVGNRSSGPLGKGGLMSLAGLESFFSRPGDTPLSVNEFLVRFRPGVSATQELQNLRSEFEADPFGLDVRGPQLPTDISNVGQIDRLPSILAAVLVAAAAAMLGHALITSIRRSRRDFAILRSLGFVRPQVLAAVLTQATCLVAIGIVIGLPLGFAVGTWQWHHFASQVGFVPTAPIAPLSLILVIPLMVALANVVALSPARGAIRQRPAAALRFE